eukprot:m.138297 g.138297  ORF g.138297 m.138297 type:complete len:73 (-) comp14010_c0_seq2:488-706(-)
MKGPCWWSCNNPSVVGYRFSLVDLALLGEVVVEINGFAGATSCILFGFIGSVPERAPHTNVHTWPLFVLRCR